MIQQRTKSLTSEKRATPILLDLSLCSSCREVRDMSYDAARVQVCVENDDVGLCLYRVEERASLVDR